MRVVRHPEVAPELEAAAHWYEERQPGLGGDFLLEYQATLHRILDEPERWRKILGDNRKLNFHRFCYAIVYSIKAEGDAVYVKAVMHLIAARFTGCIASRRPDEKSAWFFARECSERVVEW